MITVSDSKSRECIRRLSTTRLYCLLIAPFWLGLIVMRGTLLAEAEMRERFRNHRSNNWFLNKTADHNIGDLSLTARHKKRQGDLDELDAPVTCYEVRNETCRPARCHSSALVNTNLRGHVRDESNSSTPMQATCPICKAYLGQCAVSTEYKFIFIHVMKSGGSSMHKFLKSALCRPVNASSPSQASSAACAPHQFETMHCFAAIERHPTFFRWTLLRHPIPRAVSAWAMANTRLVAGARPVDFNEWALNASALRTLIWEMHWWPQASFVLDHRGCPLYDFAGTMGRSMAVDVEAILRRIGSPELWGAYRRDGVPREYATADGVREAAYRNMTPAALAALAARYRVDLETFGFRAEGWREEGYF